MWAAPTFKLSLVSIIHMSKTPPSWGNLWQRLGRSRPSDCFSRWRLWAHLPSWEKQQHKHKTDKYRCHLPCPDCYKTAAVVSEPRPSPSSSDSSAQAEAEWRVSGRLLSRRREQLDTRDGATPRTLTLSREGKRREGKNRKYSQTPETNVQLDVWRQLFAEALIIFKEKEMKSFILWVESLPTKPDQTPSSHYFLPWAHYSLLYWFKTIPPSSNRVPPARWHRHCGVMEVFNRWIELSNRARREKKKRKQSKTKLQPLFFALMVNRPTSRCFVSEAQMLIVEKIAHSQIRDDRQWENWKKSP